MNISNKPIAIDSVRALLVDDTKMMQVVFAEALSKIGIKNVVVASNGKEALDKFIEADKSGNSFHVLLTDHNMPVMTGMQLLSEISKLTPKIKPVIFMLSTENDISKFIEAAQLGAKGYLTKPCSEEEIQTKVLKELGIKR